VPSNVVLCILESLFDYCEIIFEEKKSKRSNRGASFYQLLAQIIIISPAKQKIVTLQTDSI
jgi:hypothetical protein